MGDSRADCRIKPPLGGPWSIQVYWERKLGQINGSTFFETAGWTSVMALLGDSSPPHYCTSICVRSWCTVIDTLPVDLINNLNKNKRLTPPHQRRVLLVGSDTHQGGIAGKPNHDTSQPARAHVFHLVWPSTTVVVNARCVRHSLYPAIQLPQCCLPLHYRCLPLLLLLLACPNQKLRGYSETSWRTVGTEQTFSPLVREIVSFEHEASLFYTRHQNPCYTVTT